VTRGSRFAYRTAERRPPTHEPTRLPSKIESLLATQLLLRVATVHQWGAGLRCAIPGERTVHGFGGDALAVTAPNEQTPAHFSHTAPHALIASPQTRHLLATSHRRPCPRARLCRARSESPAPWHAPLGPPTCTRAYSRNPSAAASPPILPSCALPRRTPGRFIKRRRARPVSAEFFARGQESADGRACVPCQGAPCSAHRGFPGSPCSTQSSPGRSACRPPDRTRSFATDTIVSVRPSSAGLLRHRAPTGGRCATPTLNMIYTLW
jgi:hypothetical protein